MRWRNENSYGTKSAGTPRPPFYIRKQRGFLNESAYLRRKSEKSLDKYVEKMGHFWTNMSRL